jgi:4-amino-4-deoxy-L-arabinose transferase-like glycosyltransferase
MTSTEPSSRLLVLATRHRAPLAVAALAVVIVVLDVWWYWTHRRGLPLFLDESGYTSFALDHSYALRDDGLVGLLRSVEDHSVHAPLVPFLTVPFEILLGERIGNGFIVIAAFHALLAVATYGVARRLTRPWLAALAALLVACAPQVITFSRLYYFAVPAAALFTLSVFCFLRSDALNRPAWAVAGGATLGLVALTRTLMLALVAGPLIGVLVQALARPGTRTRRMLTFGVSVLTGLAIAAIWYGPNFANAVDFLRGDRFREPSSGELRSPGLRELRQVVQTVQLPLALALLGVALLAVGVVLASAATRRQWQWRRALSDDRTLLAIVVLEATAVFSLTSAALARWITVLPLLIALAVAALGTLPRPRLRATLALGLVGAALFEFVMLSAAWPALGRLRTVDAGPLGTLTITDGRQFLQGFLAPIGYTGAPGRLPDSFRRFLPEHIQLTKWLLAYAARHDERPVVFTVGHESRLLNINDLLLADRLIEDDGVLLTGRVFLATDAPRRAYRQQLDDPKFGLPNFLITYSHAPAATRDAQLTPADENVQALGFRLIRTIRLPDSSARIWWRSQADVPASRTA